MAKDMVVRIGYIRTRGTGLLQTVDGIQDCLRLRFGTSGTNTCNNTGIIRLPERPYLVVLAPRVRSDERNDPGSHQLAKFNV